MGARARGVVPWTAAEDYILRRGIAGGRTTEDVLADLRREGFRRDMAQLWGRAARIGIKLRRAAAAWAPEHVTFVMEGYAAGESAGTIAARLSAAGRRTTRNAVCGLIDRKVQSGDLTRRGSLDVMAPRAPRVRKDPPVEARNPVPVMRAKTPPSKVPEQAAPPAELGPAGGVPFMVAAEVDLCRWPLAGERQALRVCGTPVMPGRPYCAAHMRLAYVPGTAMRTRAQRAAPGAQGRDQTPDLVDILAAGEVA